MDEIYMIPDEGEDGPKVEENKRAARLLHILTMIYARPSQWTREALAVEFDVGTRQIDKDLVALRHGLGCEIRRSQNGYYITHLPALPAVTLEATEALTMITALHLARESGLIDPVNLAAALARIESAMPVTFLPMLRALRTLGDAAPQHQHRAEMLQKVQLSLSKGQKLRIEYETASRGGARSERIVAPYALHLDGQRRILIAHDSNRDDVIMFAIDRINWAELLAATYTIPKEFNLAAYLGSGWGILRGMAGEAQEIVLHLTADEARRLRDDPHHRGQREVEQADGSWIVTFHAGVTPETARWIFRWGSGCRVLAPEELRVMVVQLARDVLALHEGEDGGGGELSNFTGDTGNH